MLLFLLDTHGRGPDASVYLWLAVPLDNYALWILVMLSVLPRDQRWNSHWFQRRRLRLTTHFWVFIQASFEFSSQIQELQTCGLNISYINHFRVIYKVTKNNREMSVNCTYLLPSMIKKIRRFSMLKQLILKCRGKQMFTQGITVWSSLKHDRN